MPKSNIAKRIYHVRDVYLPEAEFLMSPILLLYAMNPSPSGNDKESDYQHQAFPVDLEVLGALVGLVAQLLVFHCTQEGPLVLVVQGFPVGLETR